MSLTPKDELDATLFRHAAALRRSIGDAETEAAWTEFEAALADGAAHDERDGRGRRRWVIVAVAGMVAALLITLLVLDVTRVAAPDLRPVATTPRPPDSIGPAPEPESSDFVAMTKRPTGAVVAVAADGWQQAIASPSTELIADISASGWVAGTGGMSEGFYFFNLHDPDETLRFVDLAGLPGGHTSRGKWNPDGTLYAAVEGGRTLAIIDPATGDISRLQSAHPPIGYPPTWTADGTGVLTGVAEESCSDGRRDDREFAIVPIDGGAESSTIPALADGLNRVSAGGASVTGVSRARCVGEVDSASLEIVQPSGRAEQVSLAPGLLLDFVFASTNSAVWVLSSGADGRPALVEVGSSGDAAVVNTFDDPSSGIPYIAGVAPDDSMVAVQRWEGSRARTWLVPTDGSLVIEVDGQFAGFVPRALLATVPTKTPPSTTVPDFDPDLDPNLDLDAAYVSAEGGIVANDPDGRAVVIGEVPRNVRESRQIAGGWAAGVTPYLDVDVSSAGWVAATGMVSEGFWFFELGDTSREPRFIEVPGQPGGHTSRGTWNPAGTLYATVEGGETLAILDPATGDIARLETTRPPLGYPPTWAADGSGILIGPLTVSCTVPVITPRELSIKPIDGSPEVAPVANLADGSVRVVDGKVLRC
jgi:hypothetical protein